MSLIDAFKKAAIDMTGAAASHAPDVKMFSPSDVKPQHPVDLPMGPPPGYVPPAGDAPVPSQKKDGDDGIVVLKPAAIHKRNKGRKRQGDGEGGPV